MFKITKQSKKSAARTGELKTNHGKIHTPFFMPIATRGAVKNLTPCELEEIETEIILSNTYHLLARPGLATIEKIGGIHKLIGWNRPILTDSGGYQIFSLSKLIKLNNKGVEFCSPEAGNKIFLSPEKALEFQKAIGADICMVLDWCLHYCKDKKQVLKAMEKTTLWAERSKIVLNKWKTKNRPMAFGIIQGGFFKDLRKESAENLIALNFDGYAIGGIFVGETEKESFDILQYISPLLPQNKPRYLMGAGYPEQIVKAVKLGIDMFDCVIPTRHARHGEIFVFKAGEITKKNFYEILYIAKEHNKNDLHPIDKKCDCYTCGNFSKAQLHHMYKAKEPLYQRLATIHNLKFYMELMKKIRNGIEYGKI